jgi:hypothetical protein
VKISLAKQNLIKHYLYALVVAGVAIYQTGHHTFKAVVWGALVAVGAPVVEAVWVKIKAKAKA